MAGASKGNYWIIALAAINLVISFYYYLRVVKAIFMDENDQPIQKISIPTYPKIAMFICVAGIILTGFITYIYDYINSLSISL